MERRGFLAGAGALALLPRAALAATREGVARQGLETWVRLTLELIRHTPTMSPPVASRALAYLGVALYETLIPAEAGRRSLAGQLNGLSPLPPGPSGLDPAVALTAAMGPTLRALFANTGPSGQRAMGALAPRLAADAAAGVPPALAEASRRHGAAVAQALLDWAASDGGAVIENLGFPHDWTASAAPGHWVPTSKISLQQAPLLPGWGRNRPFALASVEALTLPGPTPYSENPASRFYAEAKEVCDITDALTDEQRQIARFWSDDAMLTYTPPGHWVAILMQVAAEREWPLDAQVEALARMGVAMADAFIGCWALKYRHDTVRPVTYITKVIEPGWQPLLTTPPFPEYPSGHSVQSAAAASLLTHLFGEGYAFTDESPAPDGLPARSFPSFAAAADEAAISRLYGGIHFRPAIEHGQTLGRQIAAFAVALQTRA